ncbi:hypothetical protein K3Z96_27675, partial [Pseudomonas aeruginosa]|nr:hypothetical protein [Pseudomonas aeruginosa]
LPQEKPLPCQAFDDDPQVLADYAANVGPECMLLAPLKKGVGRLRSR